MPRMRSCLKSLAIVCVLAATLGIAPEGQDVASSPTLRRDVEVALVTPMAMRFGEGISLEDLAKSLETSMKTPVVLDLAALARREITPQSVVKLNLEGVRLKTCLKLMLDQVGLTYRVIPEDNLLILTDAAGADDIGSRVMVELKAIRQEIAALKMSLDSLNVEIVPMEEEIPALRKPTIIEEIPAEDAPAVRSRPGR